MRWIPRVRRFIITQTLAVDMTDHRDALGAARPIAAGPIFATWEGAAVSLRAGENIVAIWHVTDAGNDGAPFGQRCLHAKLVVVAVKIVNALRNHVTLEVLPGAGPDAVARIHGRLAVG